jgi:hypothetical protein
MLSPRTLIGIIVGSAIIGIGGYSLVTSFGLQQVNFDDTFEPGEFTTYRFFAPASTTQSVQLTGDTFYVKLNSPEGGLQIAPAEKHVDELSIEWNHLIDGESILRLNNTGNSALNAQGYFTIVTDPIQITYHLLVITAGVVIIGFSAGFSVRKPRGF